MPRTRPLTGAVLTLLLAACACGGGDGGTVPAVPPATTTASAPCGLKPLTFGAERWQGSGLAPPGGLGALWEQTFTFSNPNPVEVRLSSLVVELDINDTGGHYLKAGRTGFRTVADEKVPARGEQERVAQAWLGAGTTPTTDNLFATTSAGVGGTDCPVLVERISLGPVPQHVLALPNCDPQDAVSPC